MQQSGDFPTLAHVLQSAAERYPERCLYIFLADGETETARLTYGELDLQARRIAARLTPLKARGERALLIYPFGPEFVAALFGCFYSGVVAVPALPEQSPRAADRFKKVIADSQATIVLTTNSTSQSVQAVLGHDGMPTPLHWVVTNRSVAEGDEAVRPLVDNAEDLAFLQYTSGSTSEPKGIAISHANLLQNQRMFGTALQTSEDTRIVTWLPIYHDLGLIGQLLHAPFVGGMCILMPPQSFLQRPIRWLRAISRYEGTYSASPNFGYELCLRKIADDDCNGIDLSSWALAVNAAEPIRESTVREFEERFAPHGFSRQAFLPAYGLAEATVCVSAGPCGQGASSIAVDGDALGEHRIQIADPCADNARFLVACGQRQLHEEILIVDPESRTRTATNRVGEIWVRGPHVAKGYWNRPEETKEVFLAQLKDSGNGPYLRTGDLGFLRDGQLYITGRIKDLIIVRGRNHYPQDIELTAQQSHTALRPGCGAAFADHTERGDELILVQEMQEAENPDFRAIAAAIRRGVAAAHGIVPHRIVLVGPRAVLKTSSGKVARGACRDAYRRGAFSIAYEDRPPVSPLAVVTRILQEKLEFAQTAPITTGTPLGSLGIDSVTAVEIAVELNEIVSSPISPDVLLEHSTVGDLVDWVAENSP